MLRNQGVCVWGWKVGGKKDRRREGEGGEEPLFGSDGQEKMIDNASAGQWVR